MQVTLGHRYLKHTLRLTFPDVSTTLARRAAQQAQQHARTQAWLQQQYTTLLGDLPSLQQQLQGLAQQLHSGLALLRAAAQQQGSPAAAGAGVVGAGASSAGEQTAAAQGGSQEEQQQQQQQPPPQEESMQHPEQQQQQQSPADDLSDDLDIEELLEGPPLGLAAYAVDRVGPGVPQEAEKEEEEEAAGAVQLPQ
jgi:chromosomal replication initiation ATPase DnaA